MFESEQHHIEEKIKSFCAQQGLPEPNVQWSWIPFSGHWGISTSFFQLAAQEARQGKAIGNVGARAQEIAQALVAYLGQPEGFARLEAVRGYLNLYFSTHEYARRVIDAVLEQGEQFGYGSRRGETVMVEFSQPNTHKALHVGHLRTMVLGDTVSNILDCAGYDVVRANYIGDIGLHVIKWLWNYSKFHAGEEPPEDKFRWVSELYVEANRHMEEDPGAEAEVRALFARWDRQEPDVVDLWKKSRQWSLDGFDQVYRLLDICFNRVYFESEVEEPGKELVARLIERGIARDERPDGAVIIPLDELAGTKDKYRVLVALRSDGTSLYSTKDLALAIQKNQEYQLARSVYVIDVRQSLYMQQIFKTLELMGFPWADRCYHLAYELVNLPGNVTLASREGAVVLLEDLVQEATHRALKIVETKNADLAPERQLAIAHAVALGAIRYSMLARDNTKIVTFDWDSALDFNGQAAPYIQYASVRAGSILRKANQEIPGSILPDYELSAVEIELIEWISRLPKEIQRAAAEYKPLYIANLAYELARTFNDFYNQCPVLQAEEPVKQFRVRVVAAARQAIYNCLHVLGMIAPEAM
ncbi:MAG: arginine--tRNA ligase [Chloroflexi bacterium]|nr:arginine--tRNA ligase [Anaerolineaceae bacterium]NMB89173.1 arginine--tRNA ligase [Chloroflexota bacterium]